MSESVIEERGETFTVEIARQGGKNELSAHLELLLLTMHIARGGSAVKCSPTFKPQTLISILRLKQRLDDFGFSGSYSSESGYVVGLGRARQVFLSADKSSSVVGHTADILLEVDEAQDVSPQKYTHDFRPMGSASNVTTVLYGTTWDDGSLLEQAKQTNLEMEKRDGVRRHFSYDWQEVARSNPAYLKFVEGERQRLGEDHPLFRTQYALKPISGRGRLFSGAQLGQVIGQHPRRRGPAGGKAYVAGIDLAGEAETPEGEVLTRPGRDSTVITIGDLDAAGEGRIAVVEQYAWTGVRHTTLYQQMAHLLKNLWNCRSVAADATGVGEGVTSFLRGALGSRVEAFKFTQASKSELGFELIAAVNSGRLRMYAADGSFEYAETMRQLEKARSVYRPNQTLNFFVDAAEGHDDYLMSLALMVRAASLGGKPRRATGR